MNSPSVLNHPVADHYIRILRNKDTITQDFRQAMHRLAIMLAVEATRNAKTVDAPVTTPLEVVAPTRRFEDNRILLVPILRAGMGFLDGFLTLLPAAKVAQIGLSRDHETLQARAYLDSVPNTPGDFDHVYILDPMLATGNSSVKALDLITAKGYAPADITFVCGFAVKEGIQQIQSKYPDVQIIAGTVDPELNEHAYIVPGLGDAGDRMYLF